MSSVHAWGRVPVDEKGSDLGLMIRPAARMPSLRGPAGSRNYRRDVGSSPPTRRCPELKA